MSTNGLNEWKKYIETNTPKGRILLTGAHAWEGSASTDHFQHAQGAAWITTDIEGDDVDIRADLHSIDRHIGDLDGIFSPATLEHIERPWVAMSAMSRSLKVGGALFLHTHQTFPLHGYPNDYYRFSVEALKSLCFDAGLNVVCASYDNPCVINPPKNVTVWNRDAESYLNVSIFAVKKE